MQGGEPQAGRLEPRTREAGGREKDGERGEEGEGRGREGGAGDTAWAGMAMAWGVGGGQGAGFWLEIAER